MNAYNNTFEIDDADDALKYITNRWRGTGISRRLLSDKQFALTAVSKYSQVLLYLYEPAYSDIDVILAAVRNSRLAISAISPRDMPIEHFTRVLELVIELNEYVCIPEKETWICSNESAAWWAARCYNSCYEQVLRIVTHCGRAIKDTIFTDDDTIALAAVRHDIRAYQFLSDRLKSTEAILTLVLNSYMPWALPDILHFIPHEFFWRDWVLQCIASINYRELKDKAFIKEYYVNMVLPGFLRIVHTYNILSDFSNNIRNNACVILLMEYIKK